MKREVCPNCGGVLVAESLGWICKSCRGFISLQDGKFYEYVEKPFMPPQTNADRIRAMSDEELEVFLCGIAATNCCGGCMVQEYCYAEHNGFWDWLRQPAKDGDNE